MTMNFMSGDRSIVADGTGEGVYPRFPALKGPATFIPPPTRRCRGVAAQEESGAATPVRHSLTAQRAEDQRTFASLVDDTVAAAESGAAPWRAGASFSGVNVLGSKRRRTLILFLVFAFIVLLILNNGSIAAVEHGDQAMWDYMAQAILRGQVPYRDVVNIKAPLSAYISAIAILGGKAAGLNQLLAIRYLGVILAGALLVVTFAVAEGYTRSRLAAFVAVLVPLTWERFYYAASAGTEPKLSMILFGMLSLLLIYKNRPFWAGAAGMLSCLCWQPGLLFAGTAVLVFSNYLRSWRDLRGVKAMIGAAVPLLIIVVYFYQAGGLSDLWKWCFVFDLTSYAPSAYRSLGQQAEHIGSAIGHSFRRTGIVVLIAAAIGYLMFWIREIRGTLQVLKRGPGERDAMRHSGHTTGAVLIAPLVYLIYLRFDFNAAPYLIPIIPFAGIFTGWFAAGCIELIQSRFKGRVHKRLFRIEAHQYAGLIVVALFLYLAISASSAKYQGTTLGDEYTLLEPLRTALTPQDTIWAQGEVNVLVLLDRPDASQYIWFDRGKDDFAGRDAAGGFQQVLGEIEAQRPKFVALGRMEEVHHQDEIEAWLAEKYTPFPILGFEVYVRR